MNFPKYLGQFLWKVCRRLQRCECHKQIFFFYFRQNWNDLVYRSQRNGNKSLVPSAVTLSRNTWALKQTVRFYTTGSRNMTGRQEKQKTLLIRSCIPLIRKAGYNTGNKKRERTQGSETKRKDREKHKDRKWKAKRDTWGWIYKIKQEKAKQKTQTTTQTSRKSLKATTTMLEMSSFCSSTERTDPQQPLRVFFRGEILQSVFLPQQFRQIVFKLPRLTEERDGGAEPGVSEALSTALKLSHPGPWSNLGKTSAPSPSERRWWGLTRRGDGLVADQACFIYCMW